MAVAVDAVSASLVRSGVANDTNTTGDLTIAAGATYAVVFVEGSLQGGNNDSGISFTVATLEGVALTEVGSARSHSGGGTTGFVTLFTLASPPTGAGVTLSLTMHSTVGGSIHNLLAFAVSYTGAVSGLGTVQLVNGSGASSQTITDTLATGDLFVGVCCNGTAAPTVTTGTSDATATGDTTTASHGGIRVSHNSGTGSVSLVYATNAGDSSSAVGIKLIAGGGAPVDESSPVLVRPGGPGGLFGPMAFQWVQQLGADEVITGSPQTVTAQVADLVLTAIPGTTTAGNATVTAQVGALTLTAIPGTTTGGPTTVTGQVASLTLTAVAGTVVAGGISGTAQVATLTLTAVAGTTTPGNATVTAQVATLTLTALAGAVIGGATTLTAQVGLLTLTAIPGTPSTVGGGQSVTAQVATLTLTARAGTVTGGATSLTAQVAVLTLTAVPGTPTPGGLTKTAQIATLALTAVPGTISATVTITAQVATLTLLGRAGALTPGPATQQAQVALLTLVGVAGTPFVGTIQPLIPPFASVINAYTSFTADAVKSITRSTITTTSTTSSTPRSSTVNTTPEGVTD